MKAKAKQRPQAKVGPVARAESPQPVLHEPEDLLHLSPVAGNATPKAIAKKRAWPRKGLESSQEDDLLESPEDRKIRVVARRAARAAAALEEANGDAVEEAVDLDEAAEAERVLAGLGIGIEAPKEEHSTAEAEAAEAANVLAELGILTDVIEARENSMRPCSSQALYV